MDPERLAAAGLCELIIDGRANIIDAANVTQILPEMTFQQVSPTAMQMIPTNNIGAATIMRHGHAPANVQHTVSETTRRIVAARLGKARLAAADIDNDKWDELTHPEPAPAIAGIIGK